MQRTIFCLSTLFCSISLALSDDATELAAIKTFPTDAGTATVILSTGFDSPQDAAQRYPNGFRIAPGEGRNGTAALRYDRTDPNAYPIHSVPLRNLQPEEFYSASVWVRGENIRATGSDRNIGAICIEYSEGGKWVFGLYYSIGRIGTDWQRIEMVFKTPPEVASGRQADLKFYLRQRIVGTIWFDDAEVRHASVPPAVILTRPDRLSFFGENGQFSLRAESNIPKNSQIAATITNGRKSRELLLKPDGLDFRGDAGKLELGRVEIDVKIADMDNKKIVGGDSFLLEAYPATVPPKNACTLDEYGRAVVDGKPFMPLGVYGFANEANYRRLKEAGFNCLHLYSSLELRGNVDRRDPIKNVQEGLDLIDKNGLKIIFSLKDQFSHKPSAKRAWGGAEGIDAVSELAVKTVKDHPALLAWYISDEEPRLEVPKILALRRLISRIDPWHPTWTLDYRFEDMPYYGISGDIIGVDPYPISQQPVEQSIKLVKTAMTAGHTTGLPVWAVPQIFNQAVYRSGDNPRAFAESHFPTLEEMRAMALYSAVLGAKGFIFYSNFDIIQRYDTLLPGSGEREWVKVVEMVKPIKELEPFVLSTKKPVPITVECEPKDSVEAGVMQDDAGNYRVIIIGTGGKARGTFTVPEEFAKLKAEPLRSKFGNTKLIGSGRYEFTADAVDSDILE